MNKNGTKVIIVVVCLAAAAVAIMWNFGVIGGSAPKSTIQGSGSTNPEKTTPPDPKANTATGEAGQLKRVNY